MLGSQPHNTAALEGQAALVTGSARGLGRAVALALAERGATVGVHYRYSAEQARDAARQIRDLGREAHVFQADVTDPEQVRRLFAEVEEKLGRLDILVNNVGEFIFKPALEMTPTEWDETLASNLHSVFYCCREAAEGMRRRRYGRIVNVGTAACERLHAAGRMAAYQLSKSGVLALSKSLALALAPDGVTVNVVSPGVLENTRVHATRPLPMGRPGRMEEVVRAVVFLASPAGEYITGANLEVAGGWKL